MNKTPFFSRQEMKLSHLLIFLPILMLPLCQFYAHFTLLNKFSLFLLFLSFGFANNQLIFLWAIPPVTLLAASLLWSVNPALSLSAAMQCFYYVIIFTLCVSNRLTHREILWSMRLLLAVALLISLDGLHQYFLRYDEYAQALITSELFQTGQQQEIASQWVAALSGRVFTRFFALPSQLAGYLLLMLPLNFILLFREKSAGLKIFWSATFVLHLIVLFLTKSFGAWLTFLGLVSLALLLWSVKTQRLTKRMLLQSGLGIFCGGIGMLYAIGQIRGQFLWDLHGNNPLWYRWLNWRTALEIFRDHVFLGTGLSTFGTMYPQYMQAGANEAQYAHNTYLQFAAELGLVGLLVVLWYAGSWGVRALKRLHAIPADDVFQYGVGCFLGGLGFLVHNIVDFDFYVFPLGMLGMALLGLTLNVLSANQPQERKPLALSRRARVALQIGMAVACLVLFAHEWRALQATAYKEQALSALSAEEYQEAEQLMMQAQHFSPDVPAYQAIHGNILLALHRPEQAIKLHREAIAAESVTPWFHAALAEAYLQTGNFSMAYVERRRAAELFPLKPIYQKRLTELTRHLSEETLLNR